MRVSFDIKNGCLDEPCENPQLIADVIEIVCARLLIRRLVNL